MADETLSLFDMPDEDVPGQLPAGNGVKVVVRSHTRHIRQGIGKRNRKAPKKPKLTKQQQFDALHNANPRVYRELVQIAHELRAEGVSRCGMAFAWEVLRYKCIKTRRTDPSMDFKLPNNHKAYYVRLISSNETNLASFFTMRPLRS